MRLQPNLRALLAMACLIVAVVLPPAELVARFLPAEYASRGEELYRGLWLFKFALALNALVWLAWRKIAAVFDQAPGPGPLSGSVDDRPRIDRAEWVLVGALTVMAMIVRSWGLGSSLTYDEIMFATSMVQKSPFHVFVNGAMNMSQFTNWLAWVTTRVLGFSEGSMRLPAFAFGVATVPATYLFARRWLSRSIATGAAILLTFSTQAVFYSQEAKGYTATSLFALGATWSFLEARRHGRRRDWAVYGVCALILGFAHVLSLAVIIGHVFISVMLPDRRKILPPLILTLTYVGCALGLIYSVSLPHSFEIATSSNDDVHFRTATLADKLVRNFGVQFAAEPWSYLMALLALVGAVRLFRINKVLLAAIVVPVLVALLLNAYVLRWVFMRYFNFELPFYLMLVASGAVELADASKSLALAAGWGRGVARWVLTAVPLVLLSVWIWPSAQSLSRYRARDRFPFKTVARRLAGLPAGSTVVAGGFGAEKYQFYSPATPAVGRFDSLADFIDRQRPEYVVTFYHRLFRNEAASRGHDPLAHYRLFYHDACHVDEDGFAPSGYIWRRSSDVEAGSNHDSRTASK